MEIEQKGIVSLLAEILAYQQATSEIVMGMYGSLSGEKHETIYESFQSRMKDCKRNIQHSISANFGKIDWDDLLSGTKDM